MSEDFPTFIFDDLAVTMTVGSRQALEDLLVILTAKFADRRRAVSYLSTALTYKGAGETTSLPTFGHYATSIALPTLGEWLAARGIVVK